MCCALALLFSRQASSAAWPLGMECIYLRSTISRRNAASIMAAKSELESDFRWAAFCGVVVHTRVAKSSGRASSAIGPDGMNRWYAIVLSKVLESWR